MVERLIINDDEFSLYLLEKFPTEEWINFRVYSARKNGVRVRRCRLSYSRKENRISRNHSAQSFYEKDPEAFGRVADLMRSAVDAGLV